jgi:arylsulfatase A-like enzyme
MQDRREFLKDIGGIGAAAFTLPAFASAEAIRRPNVILLMTDDQGYGDLTCHGNPIIKTPNLDRLHAESVRFVDFHVDPTCAPTRSALLTGRYSHRTKVWHTIMGRNYLNHAETTMAQMFKQSGYRTGLFGKWHLGCQYPYRPIDRGFDQWVGHGDAGTGTVNDYWGNDKFDDTYMRNGKWEKFKGFSTDIYFDEAMKFIKSDEKRPFFVYLPTNIPHSPWNLPKQLVDPYRDKTHIKTAYFFASIARMDSNLGRLRKMLREQGLERDTIIVYVTDNGTSGGDKVFNAGMRGRKASIYDGGHRVPCFIHWPGGELAQGSDVKHITAHIDLLPTLIDLCHLNKPKNVEFDGTSLVPLLKDSSAPWSERTLVVESQRIPHPKKWRKCAVMTDRWRLVNGKELYDMTADPGQAKDMAAEHPAVVEHLRNVYEDYWRDVSKGDMEHHNRVVVGSPHQREILLSCCDWMPTAGSLPWHHNHILKGVASNGYWCVYFQNAGAYVLELRRWPREVDAPIASSLSASTQHDICIYDKPALLAKGKALPIRKAKIQINSVVQEQGISSFQKCSVFSINLKAGKAKVQTWFMDENNKPLCGAYYVYISKYRV